MAAKEEETEGTAKAIQSYAAFGVGFVCVIIGFPLWWKTTEVYRVQLPYQEISDLAEAKVKYTVDFTGILFDDQIEKAKLAKFGEELRSTLESIVNPADERLSVAYRGNVRHADAEERQAFQEATSIQDLDNRLEMLKVTKEMGKYTLVFLPSSSKSTSATVGKGRTAYLPFSQEIADSIPLLSSIVRDIFNNEHAMEKSFTAARGSVNMKADKETMRALRSTPGYEVTFTLLNPQPDILDVKWNIQRGIEEYLEPFIGSFRDYVQVNIQSQYLHYTGISERPQKVEDTFVLNYDQLPHIINPIEAYLASHVSNNPNLNFIVYIPPRNNHPLQILDSSGQPARYNSFLSPRWGGILVYNVEKPENASLPAAVDLDMKHVMQVFLTQLRLLLGVNPQRVSKDFAVEVLPPGNAGLAEWELDQWLRGRALENVATASATLRSLAQLLEEISNIVINDDIGQEVERAVRSLQEAHRHLRLGQLKEGFIASRQAILSSENAFFDPSLLELLYFPEDQKFAIYIPLFLPICIPVIMSLMQAFRWLLGKDKVKVKAE